MAGNHARDAKDYSPFCRDQGMPNVLGASQQGLSVQYVQWLMSATGVLDFGTVGLQDMKNGLYTVMIHNHTHAAREALVDITDRLVNELTVTGSPSTSDILDIAIIGPMKGQLG